MDKRRVHKFKVVVDAEWFKWTASDKVKAQLGSLLFDYCSRVESGEGPAVSTAMVAAYKEEE